jgi:O-antigen/teichoic acid export membrane protein
MSRDSRGDPAAFAATVSRSFKLAGALAVVLIAVVIPTAGGWVGLLFGRAYSGASPAMVWLAGAVGAVYLTTLTGHALVASDQQWKHLRFAAAGAVLNVGLNLLLIPRMDFTGAALASFVSQLFMLTMELYALRDVAELGNLRTPALKLVVAGCLAFAVAQVMTVTLGTAPMRLLLIVTPASLASYAGAVRFLGILDPAERAAIRSLLQRALRLRTGTANP